MEFSRPEHWVGGLSLLQGIFPTQGSNPGLPHCRRILDQLSPISQTPSPDGSLQGPQYTAEGARVLGGGTLRRRHVLGAPAPGEVEAS